jgi:hypothetical protein
MPEKNTRNENEAVEDDDGMMKFGVSVNNLGEEVDGSKAESEDLVKHAEEHDRRRKAKGKTPR